MSAKFISDDKKIYGCGEHLGDAVWLSDQGGTLEYQKGFYLPVEKREIIQIPIVLIDDEVCDYLRNCCFWGVRCAQRAERMKLYRNILFDVKTFLCIFMF